MHFDALLSGQLDHCLRCKRFAPVFVVCSFFLGIPVFAAASNKSLESTSVASTSPAWGCLAQVPMSLLCQGLGLFHRVSHQHNNSTASGSLWPCGLAYLAYGKHSNHLGCTDMAASRTLRTISFEDQEMPGVELLHHLQKRAERWTNDWSRSRSKPIRFFLWCSQCFFCIVIVLSVAVACVWLCFYKTMSGVTITSGSTTVTHNLVVDQEVQLKGAMSQPHLTSLWSLRAVCCKMCAETVHGCKKCTNQFLMLNIVINTSAVCTLQSPA